MSTDGEIITCQIGHYANHVGTHWWNIQESSFTYDPKVQVEVDHGVLFREGHTTQNEPTFTPRVLCVDLRGGLGHLPKYGRLYHPLTSPKAECSSWSGSINVHKTEVSEKNEFLRELDAEDDNEDDQEKDICNEEDEHNIKEKHSDDKCNGFSVWSDYLRVFYNPWSIHLLPEYFHQSQHEPFDVFGYGQSQYSTEAFRDEFEDRLRAYAEECDRVEGFHILSDSYNGFSGVSSSIVNHLRDEYHGRTIFGVPLLEPNDSSKVAVHVHRILNTVLLLDSFTQDVTVLPMGMNEDWPRPLDHQTARQFPELSYNISSSYHTSAILASALDTITLPWRLKNKCVSMHDICSNMRENGRNMTSIGCSIPLALQSNDYLLDGLINNKINLTCLTPGIVSYEADIQSVVFRGLDLQQLRKTNQHGTVKIYNSTGASEMLREYYESQMPNTNTLVTYFKEPLKTSRPYPQLFSDNIQKDGCLDRINKNAHDNVGHIPLACSLQNGPAVGASVSTLVSRATKFNINKFHRFREAGLESDEFLETLERLRSLAACY